MTSSEDDAEAYTTFRPMALNLTLIMTLINLLMVGVFPAVCVFRIETSSSARTSIKSFGPDFNGVRPGGLPAP